MSYPLFIAMRYLKGKHKTAPVSFNTFISIAGVALGVMTLIVVLSVMSGFESDLKDKILGTNAPVMVTSFDEKGITDVKGLTGDISGMEHVVSAEPFTYGEVMLTSPHGVSGIILKGIDPGSDVRKDEFGKMLLKGALEGLVREGPRPGIMIGRELASQLGVTVGDTVSVVSPFGTMTPLGMAPKLKEYEVAGVFESGMYEYDAKLAYISIPQAQEFFGLGAAVSGIEVRVDDVDISPSIAEKLQDALGFPYRARDWQQMNKSLFSAIKLEKLTMFVILVLIILVASFNIISTLIMIVIEKAREIAILKSMGATRRGITGIFMIYGMIIGVTGTLIGLFGGLSICLLLKNTRLISMPSDVYYINYLPVNLDPVEIAAVSAAAIAISFAATLYPAWQAARLDPLEALRYE